MKIERYQPGRKRVSPVLVACGCLATGLVGIIVSAVIAYLIFPSLAGLILSTIGIEDLGTTEEILASGGTSGIETVPSLMDTQTVGSVSLNTGTYSQTLGGSGEGYAVLIGDTEDNMQRQMQISLTEEGMLAQCRELTTICSGTGMESIRNASFDLRSGGIVINAEIEITDGLWQDAGLVVRFDDTNRMDIVGVEIGGRVLAPTSPDYANIINEAEAQGNLFLQGLSARAGINDFMLDDIIIDNSHLTIIMR